MTMTVSVEDRASPRPRAGGSGRAARAFLGRCVREPLVHFIAIGALLSITVQAWHAGHDRYTIRVGADERRLLATRYQQQYGAAPSAGVLDGLVAGYVQQEIAVREATALGLDRDDEVIRRRLAQKYDFLESDLAATEPPAPATLERWYAAHPERYATPAQVAFRHVYFALDGARPEAAWRRARAALAQLQASPAARAAVRGDAFAGPTDVGGLAASDAVKLFGESELTAALATAPSGRWLGPYRSGYGWHLLFVTGRTPASLPALAARREQVLGDYLEAARADANARRDAALRARYRVLDPAGGR